MFKCHFDDQRWVLRENELTDSHKHQMSMMSEPHTEEKWSVNAQWRCVVPWECLCWVRAAAAPADWEPAAAVS